MRAILITGASSGIGAAAARLLAAPDTALALHARKNRNGLEKVAKAASDDPAVRKRAEELLKQIGEEN